MYLTQLIRFQNIYPSIFLRFLSSNIDHLPSTVDTCVIGGGIVGCSVAYHLARHSQHERSVILLEKAELTAGSTWHAAGLVTFYHPINNVKRLHYDSLNLYTNLPTEYGQSVGLHRCGSLRLATTDEQAQEFVYLMNKSLHKPNPQYIVDASEVFRLCPLLNMNNIRSGLYNPYDGHIDPYLVTHALVSCAKKYGAQFQVGCSVTRLELKNDGKWLVECKLGENIYNIMANNVVNCAGFWARKIAKMAGTDLPLTVVQHQYLTTSEIPEIQYLDKEIPVLRSLSGSFYARQERGGLLIGPYEDQTQMKICQQWMADGVPKSFDKELFEPDLNRLEYNLEKAMDLIPCFRDAQIRRVINGPISYTPDALPLLGPSMLSNFWIAAGFAYGIVHAGGAGKFLAEWISNGEPPYELIELDPCRFGDWATDEFVKLKASESYGMNTAIGYPKEERMAGRPTCRVSGAFDLMKRRGASMEFISGWERPAWFAASESDVEYKPSFYQTNWHNNVHSEWKAVMENVGIIDLSSFGKFYLSGVDSHKFLSYVAANKVPSLGKTCVSHCLTPSGKVMCELTITHLSNDKYLLVTGAGSEFHDLRWLEYWANYLSGERNIHVQLERVTQEIGVFGIAGPKSKLLLELITDTSSKSAIIDKNFSFMSCKHLRLKCGVYCHAIRISYTGELGWELYHDSNHTHLIYESIVKTAELSKQFNLSDFGSIAMNVLRLEKGFRAWGHEMNCDICPFEAGLDMFIRKPTTHNTQDYMEDYIGQFAIYKNKLTGLNKKLVMLSIKYPIDQKKAYVTGDESILINEKVVGYVTSGCFSYTLNSLLAMAYVPPYLIEPGTVVHVKVMDVLCPAVVLKHPVVLTQPIREAIHRKSTTNIVKS